MLSRVCSFLILPSEVSNFEQRYLGRMNRIAMGFFVTHVPVFTLIAWLNDTGPLLALCLSAFALLGPAIAINSWESKRSISVVMGITAMFMGGLLVHFGQGPVQIEMHFYFFVLLALLAVFANPMVVVAAAVTAALHHALLWMFLPASVFNYEAPFWVVAVHAAFVVLESVAACFIARSFFDNVIELEKKVAERTAALATRNRDMRMILDAVEQGFFTIDDRGEMSDERSAAVDTLLGPLDGRTSIIEIIAMHDQKAADWLEFGLDDVFGGIMPVETTIDQLPSRVKANERFLELHYTPVMEGEDVTALAMVVTDITAQVDKEKLESEMREMMTMIERISNDKSGFLEFIDESEQIVESLRNRDGEDFVLIKRKVHTLKGNAGIFGLNRLAQACHEIEDYMAEQNQSPDTPAWTRLFGSWASTRGNLRRISTDEASDVSLNDTEYRALLMGILNSESKSLLASRVAGWKLESNEKRLQRLADQTKKLAQRLEKGEISVEINAGGLRTDSEFWAEFWSSIVHVVRNAVDHGLESSEHRTSVGKDAVGRIRLATTLKDDRYIISIADDGRGIDWERVRSIAQDRGLPSTSHDDLVTAIFSDGFSTASSVTEYSGRGVGMAAVKAACDDLGGVIEINSETGIGTEIRFVFKTDAMAPNTVKLLSDHGIENPLAVVSSERLVSST